ncbi:uncharacterized protein METZ01_LOCUS107371, partial [marine metagenome]
MKSVFVTVFSLIVLVFASDDTDKPIILKVARMVDVEKRKVIKDATVVIIGDKIETVNPRRIPKNGRVIDLGDVTLMPGLMDMHRHLTSIISKNRYMERFTLNAQDHTIRAVANAEKALMMGFTSVRNVGDRAGATVALRNAINKG